MTAPRKTRLAESILRMAEITDVYKILVWKPGKNISIERYGSRWEDNIKIDFTNRVDVDNDMFL